MGTYYIDTPDYSRANEILEEILKLYGFEKYKGRLLSQRFYWR